ncbi:hypothetical protein GCM10009837_55570 [Streptomyces durmitorensis]|uniref:Hydrogenase expression protein HypF n=1 Tax=Streptomyces durmitorensis TaxID=319947 RepID=A0ABY4PT02_9ACTN|nr:hypothetical protein [Streptomyces durmitorensis]UQT56215.1 hypothetical protein M4V62_14565 [Streptomyces durmitorensis]
MPADEVHQLDSAGEPRVRSGPRHAAPRKPLLTRLHVPAGKAIAIAAMPTAVLMGMGLTPQLAQAKPLPKNPFQDGPCVTAPDDASEATKDAEKEADEAAAQKAEKEKAEQAEKDAAEKADKSGKDDSGEATAEPTPSPSAGDDAGSDGDKAEPDSSASKDDEADKAEEPAPEPSETKNPLDPLGVGPALKDLFTPDEKESASPTPTPSASEEAESSESAEDTAKDTVDDVTKPVKDTVDGVTDGVKDGADKAEDTVDKAKEEAEKAAEEAADKAEAEESADPMAPDENGKKPFPCVVEKKVDGKAEQTPAPIPNQPWNLEASSLTLKGADYQGVVNLTMPNGQSKQALKYVVQNTDIGDLHQIVEGPAGKKYHVQAEKGSTSTIRGGETTMYTESISGKLFGLIPITFDPEHPPPLNIPLIYFTDVKVKQAGQFGGNLHVPGLSQTITD